jgi:hypothetical protein
MKSSAFVLNKLKVPSSCERSLYVKEIWCKDVEWIL